MNILDENGESYFVTAFDHSTQEQGTATSKDAFTGGDINASLTQEVVELREEVAGHGTDQLLYLAGKDSGLVSDDLVDIAVFQYPGIERITLACDTVVEGNDALLEALYHCQIRMAAAQLQDIDGKAANVNDIGDGMSFQRAELGNGSCKRLGIAEYLADPDRVVLAVILKIHDLAPTQEVLLETAVQLLIVCGRQTHKQGIATAIWCLDGQADKLLDTYHREIAAKGLQTEKMVPALRFSTSDVGMSGANLYPIFLVGAESRIVPLGYSIRTEHKNGVDMQYFEEQLRLVYWDGYLLHLLARGVPCDQLPWL